MSLEICHSEKLYDLYLPNVILMVMDILQEADIIEFIKSLRLRWSKTNFDSYNERKSEKKKTM
jgi:hypothetical protein